MWRFIHLLKKNKKKNKEKKKKELQGPESKEFLKYS